MVLHDLVASTYLLSRPVLSSASFIHQSPLPPLQTGNMPAAASQNGEQENLTEPSPPIRKTPSRSRGIGPFLVLLVLVNLSWSLYQLPLIRVIERRLCREYYLEHNPDLLGPGGDVEEHLCKINEVQKGLGWIQGTMETTWILGGMYLFPSEL